MKSNAPGETIPNETPGRDEWIPVIETSFDYVENATRSHHLGKLNEPERIQLSGRDSSTFKTDEIEKDYCN